MPSPTSAAWVAGFDAYTDMTDSGECTRPDDNPHPEGTDVHRFWFEGWRTADRRNGPPTLLCHCGRWNPCSNHKETEHG